MSVTKREAIKQVRECADAIIEQQARRARGWDRGVYRDDVSPADRAYRLTISEHLEACSQIAFDIVAEQRAVS